MTTLDDAVALAAGESGLAVVSTVRADGTVQASLVNVGLLPHPATAGNRRWASPPTARSNSPTCGRGRNWPSRSATAGSGRPSRAARSWPAPMTRAPWLADADQLRLLLREVFTAAGGTHDDWDEYDRVMAKERRAVVLIAPTRVYSNG